MGLDMYLEKRTYVKRWKHQKDEEQFEVSVQRGGKPFPDIKQERVKSVIEELMYWRKANQIHNWFIVNCADGDVDQTEMWVSGDDLKSLLQTCEKVIAGSKLVKGKIKNGQRGTKDGWEDIMEDGEYIEDPSVAKELLPTTSGFFFGSEEYDQYYLEAVIRTRDMLKEELGTPETERRWPDYHYTASW